MPIWPTVPTLAGLSYPVKKLLEFAAKNSMGAQDKTGKEIIRDLIKRDNPSFYSEQTRDGGNEIDTYLYGTPYSTENTSNIGPSYENYLSAKFPLRKHAVKTYDTHFGDTLYIDQKYKDQVLDELEQGKTVGASMGRYAHAPSYIVNTKDDERRPYDAGGHLMQFQYDKDGNVIANMSDIYDFLPRDFEEKYGAIKEYGPLKTAGMYAMHYAGTPFIVRQNGIPVRFKEIVPEYKTELQSKLGNFLSEWGDTFDLTIPHRLTDEQIKEIFDGKEYGNEILDFMDQKGYLTSAFKKGGSIHIKKKNRGKFTAAAKRAGMSVQEFAKHVLANKENYSSTMVKRANFARNSKKFKHENGGIVKYQDPNGSLPDPDITPASVTAVSKDHLKFFEDFANRYNKMHRDNKSKEILNIVNGDTAINRSDMLGNRIGGQYSKTDKRITLSDDPNTNTYTHELVHKLNDSGLQRSRREYRLLKRAYPLSNFKFDYDKTEEQFSTNTELRRRISRKSHISGDRLNTYIKNMSDSDLLNYVNGINGYVDWNDYRKYGLGIRNGKSLYKKYKKDMEEFAEDGEVINIPKYKDLPIEEKKAWQTKFENKQYGYLMNDKRKIKALRKALINVAKLGGILK